MARSTGIIIAAGGISFANKWLEDNKVDLKIPVATLAVALVFSGIEKASDTAAVGLAWIVLITVLVTPAGGAKKAPIQNLALIGKGK